MLNLFKEKFIFSLFLRIELKNFEKFCFKREKSVLNENYPSKKMCLIIQAYLR